MPPTRYSKRIVFSAMVLWSVGCVTARESRIDTLMKEYDSAAAPGASVVVVRNGEVVFRKSYGMANLEESTPVELSTNFRLASVTKQFTAAAILLLAERSKLSLGDSIATFFPALPKTITIRHLLTHTSGLIDYEDVMPEGATEQLKDADVLRAIEGRELYFAPGASHRYSNTGYALLALIAERASGVSFATFLRDNLFVPRGMKSSVAHEEGISTVSNRAYGYSRDGDGWRRTDQSRTSAVLGDGGIYSSVDDLVAWLRSLDGDRLFDEAMSPLVASNDPKVRYGFGWRVAEGRVWHTGETIGFRNALVRFPAERVAVIVLTNRNEGSPYEKVLAIARTFGVGVD